MQFSALYAFRCYINCISLLYILFLDEMDDYKFTGRSFYSAYTNMTLIVHNLDGIGQYIGITTVTQYFSRLSWLQ